MKKLLNVKLIAFIFIVLSSLLIPTKVTANFKYEVILETGSQVLEVEYYNPSLWNDTISVNATPSDWFKGNSNIVGAQSKYTNIWKIQINFEISSNIFKQLFFKWYDIPYIEVLQKNGYDADYINILYPGEFDAGYVYNRYWAFRNQPFNDFPYDIVKDSIVFLNLTDFNKSLTNYNDFAPIVNNDTLIQSLGVHLPILTSDEFAWQYLINSPIIPVPVSDYLREMIDILNCENITVEDNQITFHKMGNEPYNVKITFSDLGRIDTISIYDSEGELIYKIVSFYPKILFFIILGFSSVILVGLLVVYMIKRKKKRKIL